MEQVQALIFTIRQADATRLDDLAYAEKTVRMLAKVAGLHVLESVSHQFLPQGVSVSLLLAESHATRHHPHLARELRSVPQYCHVPTLR